MTVVLGVGCTLLYTIVPCCTGKPKLSVNAGQLLPQMFNSIAGATKIYRKKVPPNTNLHVNVSKCYAFCPSWLRAAHELRHGRPFITHF